MKRFCSGWVHSFFGAPIHRIRTLTRATAQDVAPKNIRVNTIAPGAVDTRCMPTTVRYFSALCRAWPGVAYAVAVIGGSEVGFCAAVERPVSYRDRRRGRSRIVTSENLADLRVSMDGRCECFQVLSSEGIISVSGREPILQNPSRIFSAVREIQIVRGEHQKQCRRPGYSVRPRKQDCFQRLGLWPA